MARNQAGEIDGARLIELPHQAANLACGQSDHIWFCVLHPRRLSHFGRMGLQISNGTDHHFMGDFSRILDKEANRSEEHTSELQSLMRISYAVFCLKKKH